MRWLLTIVVLVTVGCGSQIPPMVVRGVSCAGLSDEVCRRLAEGAGFGTNPTVIGVHVECTLQPCTAASGEAKLIVRRTDGRVDESNTSWDSVGAGVGQVPAEEPAEPPAAGGSLPAGVVPICAGIAQPRCGEFAVDIVDWVPRARRLVTVTVTCKGRCDAVNGEGTTRATLDDGSTVEIGWVYKSPRP